MFTKILDELFNSSQLLLSDEVRLEKVARELCRLRGINPDGQSELVVDENGQAIIQPFWKGAVREIKAHLQVVIAIELVG